MTDTLPAVEREYRRLLLARSNAERFTMATRAFDAARTLAVASFPPGLSADQVRRRLFARIYGDLPAAQVPEALREPCAQPSTGPLGPPP
jgi:hypothetical protein